MSGKCRSHRNTNCRFIDWRYFDASAEVKRLTDNVSKRMRGRWQNEKYLFADWWLALLVEQTLSELSTLTSDYTAITHSHNETQSLRKTLENFILLQRNWNYKIFSQLDSSVNLIFFFFLSFCRQLWQSALALDSWLRLFTTINVLQKQPWAL